MAEVDGDDVVGTPAEGGGERRAGARPRHRDVLVRDRGVRSEVEQPHRPGRGRRRPSGAQRRQVACQGGGDRPRQPVDDHLAPRCPVAAVEQAGVPGLPADLQHHATRDGGPVAAATEGEQDGPGVAAALQAVPEVGAGRPVDDQEQRARGTRAGTPHPPGAGGHLRQPGRQGAVTTGCRAAGAHVDGVVPQVWQPARPGPVGRALGRREHRDLEVPGREQHGHLGEDPRGHAERRGPWPGHAQTAGAPQVDDHGQVRGRLGQPVTVLHPGDPRRTGPGAEAHDERIGVRRATGPQQGGAPSRRGDQRGEVGLGPGRGPDVGTDRLAQPGPRGQQLPGVDGHRAAPGAAAGPPVRQPRPDRHQRGDQGEEEERRRGEQPREGGAGDRGQEHRDPGEAPPRGLTRWGRHGHLDLGAPTRRGGPRPHQPPPARTGAQLERDVARARDGQGARAHPQHRARRPGHRVPGHLRLVEPGAVGGAEVGDRRPAGAHVEPDVAAGDARVGEGQRGLPATAEHVPPARQADRGAGGRAADHVQLQRAGGRPPGTGCRAAEAQDGAVREQGRGQRQVPGQPGRPRPQRRSRDAKCGGEDGEHRAQDVVVGGPDLDVHGTPGTDHGPAARRDVGGQGSGHPPSVPPRRAPGSDTGRLWTVRAAVDGPGGFRAGRP